MLTLKAGDTWPSVEATLALGGAAISLAGATVTFVLAKKGGPVVLRKLATIVDAAKSTVQYKWAAEDTAVPGHYYGEFQVTFPDGASTTVPNDSYIEVMIYPSLGRASL